MTAMLCVNGSLSRCNSTGHRCNVTVMVADFRCRASWWLCTTLWWAWRAFHSWRSPTGGLGCSFQNNHCSSDNDDNNELIVSWKTVVEKLLIVKRLSMLKHPKALWLSFTSVIWCVFDAVLADCKLGVKVLVLSQPALCFVPTDASLKITLLSQPSVWCSG